MLINVLFHCQRYEVGDRFVRNKQSPNDRGADGVLGLYNSQLGHKIQTQCAWETYRSFNKLDVVGMLAQYGLSLNDLASKQKTSQYTRARLKAAESAHACHHVDNRVLTHMPAYSIQVCALP